MVSVGLGAARFAPVPMPIYRIWPDQHRGRNARRRLELVRAVPARFSRFHAANENGSQLQSAGARFRRRWDALVAADQPRDSIAVERINLAGQGGHWPAESRA